MLPQRLLLSRCREEVRDVRLGRAQALLLRVDSRHAPGSHPKAGRQTMELLLHLLESLLFPGDCPHLLLSLSRRHLSLGRYHQRIRLRGRSLQPGGLPTSKGRSGEPEETFCSVS